MIRWIVRGAIPALDLVAAGSRCRRRGSGLCPGSKVTLAAATTTLAAPTGRQRIGRR